MNAMQHPRWMVVAAGAVLAAVSLGASTSVAVYVAAVSICPVMMVVMMGSHTNNDDRQAPPRSSTRDGHRHGA